ncbi:hypothetical protein [Lignipirellula cremea]|uniref:Chromosome partition protein Smc n=1 Tax=Lignipirellula cremea TaxID=2528010 RepID=A0A518DWP3_9BACT|nr:hypothetical protein [Lignipirellula cremea]QDU96258.1 hypothetical protein Pla8534_40770 [Lignipirellula cremea]
MPNLLLFDDDAPEVADQANGRSEPVIWLRRLKIVEELRPDADVVREITFRRGMNVIATAIHPGDPKVVTVGHSVGKSLLTRLIRYCFGEASYTDRIERGRIFNFLPHGFVIAEIVLKGQRWHVARPMGLDPAVSASWCGAEEPDLFERSDRRPYRDFQTAVSEAIMTDLPKVQLPKAQRRIEWLDLLGWLSPDQQCGHKSHVRWRPGGSDPGSRGLTIEDNHVVVRAVMDLLSPEDSGLISAHKNLLRQQGLLTRETELARALVDARSKDAMAAAGDLAVEMEGALHASLLEGLAKEKRESLERLLNEFPEDDPVEKWLEGDNEIQRTIGETNQKLAAEKTDLEVAENELEILETGEQELLEQAELGEWCRLFLTKKEAMKAGCPGNAHLEPGASDPHKEQRIRELKSIITRCGESIGSLEKQMEELEKEAEFSREKLREAREKVVNRRRPLQQKIEQYRRIEVLASTFRAADEHVEGLIGQRQSLREQIDESKERRRAADLRYRTNLEIMSSHFRFALSRIMGQKMSGDIRINAQGIVPHPSPEARSHGIALGTSSLVYAFDLACLAASIAGLGSHPRFQLHDSPRDADMEEPLYHRLFELVGEIESRFAFDQAPFQYIITTTTRAPDAFNKKPFLRLMLDAREKEGLLLK